MPQPEPTYTRPDADERLTMVRLHAQGWSDPRIGRELGRDHKTVGRALEPQRIQDLAFDLVQLRQDDAAAVWVAQQVGACGSSGSSADLSGNGIRRRLNVGDRRKTGDGGRVDPKVVRAVARRHPELHRLGLV